MPTGEEPDESWLKADLLAYAQNRGLDVSESMTKAEILSIIRSEQ